MLACYRGARRSIGIAFTEKVLLVGVLAGRQFLRRPTRSTTLLESLMLSIYLSRDGGESSRLDSTNARARARDGCGEEKRGNNRGKSAWLVRFTFSTRAETFSTAGAVSRFIRSLAIANVSTLAHSHTRALANEERSSFVWYNRYYYFYHRHHHHHHHSIDRFLNPQLSLRYENDLPPPIDTRTRSAASSSI